MFLVIVVAISSLSGKPLDPCCPFQFPDLFPDNTRYMRGRAASFLENLFLYVEKGRLGMSESAQIQTRIQLCIVNKVTKAGSLNFVRSVLETVM